MDNENKVWDKIAVSWDDYRQRIHPTVKEFVLRTHGNLLDLGCGSGRNFWRLRGQKLHAIDFSKEMIKLARINAQKRRIVGNFSVSSADELDFEDNFFEGVLFWAVLHCIKSRKKRLAVLSEIYRVLRPGGRAILMMYHRNSWLFYFTKLINSKLEREDAPFYLTYSIDEFREMLRDFSSFEIVVERFPVATRIHKGFLPNIYNYIFVPAFKLIPRKFIKRFGAHLIAISVK